ncbi:MAG: rubrerythrin family protein [Candidatus Woesearchaeota archaeon]
MDQNTKKLIDLLLKAYVGECLARTRYIFYSKIARKENFFKVEEVFQMTAENELEHAEWFSRMIKSLEPDFSFGQIEVEEHLKLGNTLQNLETAIQGEHYENTDFYQKIADFAQMLGFKDIEKRVRSIAVAEKHHEERFRKLVENLQNNTLWKKEKEVYWVCRKCGYVHYGKEPPQECPSCGHTKEYYELMCESF